MGLCLTGMLFLAAAIGALLLFSAVRVRASYQDLATLQLDQENRIVNLVYSGSENRPEADFVQDFDTVMGQLREVGLEPVQESLLGDISQAFQDYRQERDEVIELVRERSEAARQGLKGEMNPRFLSGESGKRDLPETAHSKLGNVPASLLVASAPPLGYLH